MLLENVIKKVFFLKNCYMTAARRRQWWFSLLLLDLGAVVFGVRIEINTEYCCCMTAARRCLARVFFF